MTDPVATNKTQTAALVTPRDLVSKPDTFDGDPERLDRFLLQLDLYFDIIPAEDRTKIIIVFSCYKGGNAEEWA
jgi:hypothetical protein